MARVFFCHNIQLVSRNVPVVLQTQVFEKCHVDGSVVSCLVVVGGWHSREQQSCLLPWSDWRGETWCYVVAT